ncbi:MAG: hypothetical protein H0W72_09035 [Planctomycetes bacterium]|nr:hypothetical protein [Planctomycetota bacterium]
MLLLDAGFVAMHLTLRFADSGSLLGSLVSSTLWSLETEGGFAERYGYAKSALITGVLLLTAMRARVAMPAVLAGVFALILADDAFQIHERTGYLLQWYLQVDTTSVQQLGELMAWAVLGVVVLGALGIGMWRSQGEWRRLAVIYVALIAALCFFAIVVDGLHSSLKQVRAMGLIEDGGELVVLSVIAAVTAAILGRTRRVEQMERQLNVA